MLLGILVCLVLVQPVQSAIVEREPVRALHFVLRGVSLEKAYWIVDEAKRAGLNTVIVLVTDGVTLQHSPWREKSGAWSREDFKAWVGYVQDKGMQVIPELKLLTHQEKLFQKNYPELMFNRKTYNPELPATYARVFSLVDEVIEITSTKAIHIGHDEVAGNTARLEEMRIAEGEIKLPAKLFLQDILKIHQYLSPRGIEIWMWGDMLISPDEFPGMKPNPLHGRSEGYGRTLRQKLPKDIVICDWHYADDQEAYPSLAAFKAEGFRVLGATWKKEKTIRNFSRYAAEHGANGMIATTWFHVQRKDWSVVRGIIRASGRIFSKDFPDAR